MPHYENEVPFEVRESWEWVTLGELCSFLSRGKSPKYSEERIYPVFAQKCNLYDEDISLEKARFLDPDTISKWSEEYKLNNHYTPLQLIGMLKGRLEKELETLENTPVDEQDHYSKVFKVKNLKHLIEECDDWCDDETEFEEG
jgi:hypothetical protein